MSTATVTRLRCLVCHRPIDRPQTGRPPSYCGESCRRLAEFEIRRVDRRLSKLEDLASDARIQAATAPTESVRDLHARYLDACSAESDRLLARLRDLFEGGEAP